MYDTTDLNEKQARRARRIERRTTITSRRRVIDREHRAEMRAARFGA